MKPARMLARRAVGQSIYAHLKPGSTKIASLECLLCREIVYKNGPEPYVASGLVKALRLHFMLAHDIEATDIPERK